MIALLLGQIIFEVVISNNNIIFMPLKSIALNGQDLWLNILVMFTLPPIALNVTNFCVKCTAYMQFNSTIIDIVFSIARSL